MGEKVKKIKKIGWIGEFRKFILRGNVIDLAVGVIIGAAFQKIVSSLVEDVINPLITLVTGGVNFIDQFIILKIPDNLPEGITVESIKTLADAKKYGVPAFGYGSFITNVINFLIMAFVVFWMIKIINKLSDLPNHLKKGETHEEITPPEPTTKDCPFCFTEINIKATRCPNCTTKLNLEE